MTNLVIDIGNTFSKLAIFNNREMKDLVQIDNLTLNYLHDFLEERTIDNAVISSVNTEIDDFEALLNEKANYFRFTGLSRANIINHYKTPQTLGLDRYAAVIGAQCLYPGQNCLVIDAGSCITYDFVDAAKNYWGGSITPGIAMRFKALNRFTGRLPLVESNPDLDVDYGNDTVSAILTGIQKGVFYEALGFINSFHKKWEGLKVLLCGGDVKFFDTELKSSIFAHAYKTEPNLVLIGLNEVIHYNND
ncbi:MAG: type III pantothenate kinase [Sphingobacteriaceae bacterium]|nr:type III pantothenate kinase [Sphingobacteriaceae bacterium]